MTTRYPLLGIALWALCALICLIPPVAYVLGFGGYLNGMALAGMWGLLPRLQVASAVALALLAYLDRPPTIPRPWLGRWPGRAAGVLYGVGVATLIRDLWWPPAFALDQSGLLLLGGAALYGLWTVGVRMPPSFWQRWAVRLLAHIAFVGVLFGVLTSRMY
ncbi:MAG: hypothetical protein HGA45_13965 [Chloroflexales bacterium]|nr:hypothetical protein [Chloroflexales bacterium]